MVSATCPTAFERELVFVPSIDFKVQWQINEDSITLRLSANTDAWLGFGISEAGHMLGSDIVTVRMDPEQLPIVEDRFVNWAASPDLSPFPDLDSCQDWVLVCASRVDGKSQYVVTRKLNTRDTQDRPIVRGITRVIFAWGRSSEVADHLAQRGTVALDFFTTESLVFVPPADSDSSTVLLSTYTTTQRTEYILRQFDMGEEDEDRHIVAVNLVIPEEDKKFIHHILLHDCGADGTAFPLTFIPFNAATTVIPGSGVSPLFFGACQGLVFGYGMGGTSQVFPGEAGYRLGKTTGRFLVMEIHIDNPALERKTINSGMELFTTQTLRQFDAGGMAFGDAGVKFESIPANQPAFRLESTCPTECTKTFAGPIKIIRTFPHMHLYGREIWTTLVDGETGQSTLLSSRKFWNFGTQTSDAVDITVKPGDRLSTTCVYDSSKSPTPVVFGQASSEEMCMDFIVYYPKENGGSRCGYDSPTRTNCGARTFGIANPSPVSEVTNVPDNTGVVPRSCNPDEITVDEQPTTAAPSTTRNSATTLSALAPLLLLLMLFL